MSITSALQITCVSRACQTGKSILGGCLKPLKSEKAERERTVAGICGIAGRLGRKMAFATKVTWPVMELKRNIS
jgi:hypothetical protein